MDWLHLWNLEATSMFFYCLINKLVTVVHILYTLFLTKHQTYKDSIPDKRVPGIGQFSCLLRKLQKVEVKEERNGGTFDFPTRQSKCLQTSLSLHSLYTIHYTHLCIITLLSTSSQMGAAAAHCLCLTDIYI